MCNNATIQIIVIFLIRSICPGLFYGCQVWLKPLKPKFVAVLGIKLHSEGKVGCINKQQNSKDLEGRTVAFTSCKKCTLR